MAIINNIYILIGLHISNYLKAIDCFVVESQFLQFLIPEWAWTKSHFPWIIFHLLLIPAKLSPDFMKHFLFTLWEFKKFASQFTLTALLYIY